MVQTLQPISTLAPDLWTAVGDTPSHATVDEGVDTHDGNITYLKVVFGGNRETVLGVASGSDPGVHSGHVLRMQYRRAPTVGNPNQRIGIKLYQGAVAVTGINRTPPATITFQLFEYTLSTAEAASITDYADLRIGVFGPSPLVFGIDSRITAVELQLPEVVGDVVAWTLAEGASDAVVAALNAGMSAKLDALDVFYGDIVLPDIVNVYRNPMQVDDGVEAFPALAVYSPGGALPVINNGGHADGQFEVFVQVLVKDEDQTVLQKQIYRYIRAVAEVLVEAWVDSTLDGWNLQAQTMVPTYSPIDAGPEWTSGALLRVQLNKLEDK